MKAEFTSRQLTLIGLSVALMGVFSQLSIPLPTVPLTMQVFGAILLSIILGAKLGTFTMITYILVGSIGIPVFANFGRGLGAIVGPTGGYITGFIVLAWVIGKAVEQKNKIVLIVGTYLGLIMLYIIGTLQLKLVLDMSLEEAMIAGVYPFILKDIILAGVAIVVGVQIKNRIRGILNESIKA